MDQIKKGQSVDIIETFPRDGLQGLEPDEYKNLTTEKKLDLINKIADCGFSEIEVASFAHPDLIPQLADAEAVIEGLAKRNHVTFTGLVPNKVGLERAIDVGVEKVSFLVTASETYQMKNANMSIDENISQIRQMAMAAKDHGIDISAGVGIGFICPYEGIIPENQVIDIFKKLYDAGIRELSIADSVGMADPKQIYDRCTTILDTWDNIKLGLHLHNRHGLALANVVAGLEAGVYQYSSTIGGIGAGIAMPAGVNKRLMGNISTEELVRMVHRLSLQTGIDLDEVRELSKEIGDVINYKPESPVIQTGTLDEFLE